ncbi:MAG: rhodanese-related sulfurtransferase [Bacteroidetes bacterium]|nr:rhodanese-related sulfurtransferase [Bacteroidota bacterium]
MALLVNRIDKNILKQQLAGETFCRKTISFYRYVLIDNPAKLRDELYFRWHQLNCFGRVYIAGEGINAQMSIPEANWNDFIEHLYHYNFFKDVPFKHAVDGNGKSFYKLIVKVRNKIVADGINDPLFNPANTGNYLSAQEFNAAINNPETIVVDMRNHYESEVGRFERAFCPDADTFREELPQVIEHLKGKEDKKIVMYCTGGIRCEKASAYFKHKGFKDVNHLRGGIIQYAKEIKESGLESKFKGVNFVFDERIGERITEDVLSKCHQCGNSCDRHVNCKNDDCHLLFIQCKPCEEKMQGCCTQNCVNIINLPIDEQRRIRKGRVKNGPECLAVYKSRLRPNLSEILKNAIHLTNTK